MKLNPVEQLVVQEAEEERTRAMQHLEHGQDGIVLAQMFKSAAESYAHAAELIALRMRVEARAARKAGAAT